MSRLPPRAAAHVRGHRPSSALSPALDAATACCQDGLIEVGVIVGLHGIKGEVKIQITTDDPAQRFGKAGKT